MKIQIVHNNLSPWKFNYIVKLPESNLELDMTGLFVWLQDNLRYTPETAYDLIEEVQKKEQVTLKIQ